MLHNNKFMLKIFLSFYLSIQIKKSWCNFLFVAQVGTNGLNQPQAYTLNSSLWTHFFLTAKATVTLLAYSEMFGHWEFNLVKSLREITALFESNHQTLQVWKIDIYFDLTRVAESQSSPSYKPSPVVAQHAWMYHCL